MGKNKQQQKKKKSGKTTGKEFPSTSKGAGQTRVPEILLDFCCWLECLGHQEMRSGSAPQLAISNKLQGCVDPLSYGRYGWRTDEYVTTSILQDTDWSLRTSKIH